MRTGDKNNKCFLKCYFFLFGKQKISVETRGEKIVDGGRVVDQ